MPAGTVIGRSRTTGVHTLDIHFDGSPDPLAVTANHRVYSPSLGGWAPAGLLDPGDTGGDAAKENSDNLRELQDVMPEVADMAEGVVWDYAAAGFLVSARRCAPDAGGGGGGGAGKPKFSGDDLNKINKVKSGMGNNKFKRELHAWKQKEGRGNKGYKDNADLDDQDLLDACNDGVRPPE